MSAREYVTGKILSEVGTERERQKRLKDEGRFRYTPSDCTLLESYAMLSEEYGEVARGILSVNGLVQEDLNLGYIRKELIQVAAIAVAMIEGIDTQPDEVLLGRENGKGKHHS